MAQKYLSQPQVILLISGELEKIHMALMTAAAGGAVGRPMVVFISKSALTRFSPDGWEKTGGADYDKHLSDRGVADRGVLLDAIRSLEVRLVVCDAALAEHDMKVEDLDPALGAEVGGLSALLVRYAGADWITF